MEIKAAEKSQSEEGKKSKNNFQMNGVGVWQWARWCVQLFNTIKMYCFENAADGTNVYPTHERIVSYMTTRWNGSRFVENKRVLTPTEYVTKSINNRKINW